MLKRMRSPWHTPFAASLVWLAGSACSASSRPTPPIDCNAGDAYELSAPLRVFDIADEVWYTGADPTGSKAPPVAAAANAVCATGGTGGTSTTDAGGTATTAGTGGSATGTASIS